MDRNAADVIQNHMQALRTEMLARIESHHQIWRLTIIGIAAVLVFSPTVDPASLFPVVPVVAATVLAFWLISSYMICRTGYSLARAEAKLNEVTGKQLVEHEVPLWKERQQWLHYLAIPASIAGITTIALLLLLLHELIEDAKSRPTGRFDLLSVPGAEHSIWTLFGVASLVSLVTLWRLIRLRKHNV